MSHPTTSKKPSAGFLWTESLLGLGVPGLKRGKGNCLYTHSVGTGCYIMLRPSRSPRQIKVWAKFRVSPEEERWLRNYGFKSPEAHVVTRTVTLIGVFSRDQAIELLRRFAPYVAAEDANQTEATITLLPKAP